MSDALLLRMIKLDLPSVLAGPHKQSSSSTVSTAGTYSGYQHHNLTHLTRNQQEIRGNYSSSGGQNYNHHQYYNDNCRYYHHHHQQQSLSFNGGHSNIGYEAIGSHRNSNGNGSELTASAGTNCCFSFNWLRHHRFYKTISLILFLLVLVPLFAHRSLLNVCNKLFN